MIAPRWRLSLIGAWYALTCLTLIAIDSPAARSWLLLVFGFAPAAMLLWFWNENRPLVMASPRPGRNVL